MVSKAWKNVGFVAALAGATSLEPSSRADDKPAPEPRVEVRAEAKVVTLALAGKHWIGLHASPITDEALRSQLNLKDRLIVVQVMPDSPSAKAGVKQHDILLKFGDRDLATLEDLVKAVNDNGEKESKLLVLRGGKEIALTVIPADRPAEDVLLRLRETAPHELRVWLEDGKLDGAGRLNLRVLGPGIAAGAFNHIHHAFPNGLSLSVSKENDQPAKIIAKKDGKTYETTEGKLGELPEEIRVHAQRLLAAPQIAVLSNDTLKNLHGAGPQVTEELKKAIDSAKKHALELKSRAEGVRNTIEVRRTEGGAIDELRKELDSLRKEVEKLKADGKSETKSVSSDKPSETK